MTEHHIEIKKTARYLTLGELNEKTKEVWFVLHGWGMNVKGFLQSFEPLLNDEIFFIAPEALNRFYVKGTGGEIGATWMTREDRLNEIKDYIAYLDSVYTEHDLQKKSSIKITALGFSQGASTVTRWVDATKNRIDNLIVYAGEVAPELLPLKENSGLKKTDNIFICGTQDEYFTPPLVSKMKENYREMNFTEIEFDGKHAINIDVLKIL
jgi:predicted esterase